LLRTALISILLILAANPSSYSQEYIYPNKLLSDQGLIEYGPYTLEEARAYEQSGSFFTTPPFLTDWGPERRLTEQENVYSARAISVVILCCALMRPSGETNVLYKKRKWWKFMG